MRINFISFKDTGEIHTMNSKSDNVEIMMGSETEDIIDELFETFLQKNRRRNERKRICF